MTSTVFTQQALSTGMEKISRPQNSLLNSTIRQRSPTELKPHSTTMFQERALLAQVNDYQKSTTFKQSMYDMRLYSDAIDLKRIQRRHHKNLNKIQSINKQTFRSLASPDSKRDTEPRP